MQPKPVIESPTYCEEVRPVSSRDKTDWNFRSERYRADVRIVWDEFTDITVSVGESSSHAAKEKKDQRYKLLGNRAHRIAGMVAMSRDLVNAVHRANEIISEMTMLAFDEAHGGKLAKQLVELRRTLRGPF